MPGTYGKIGEYEPHSEECTWSQYVERFEFFQILVANGITNADKKLAMHVLGHHWSERIQVTQKHDSTSEAVGENYTELVHADVERSLQSHTL